MRFAREGLPFMWAAVIIALSVGAAAFRWPRPLVTTAAVICVLLAVWVAYFFRDPERTVPAEDVVVSPADGKVVDVRQVDLDGQRTWKISIFLSLFDVHVNRAPVSGTIQGLRYQPGRFRIASRPEASLENEQNTVTIQGDRWTVTFRQIAGLLARRIVFRKKVGDRVERGERVGLI